MSIKETINQKMIEALKAGNKQDKLVYSQALDAIKKQEINKRTELTDEQAIEVLRKEIKQYEETKSFAQQNSRTETVEECIHAIALLNNFVPRLMDREQVIQWINDNVQEEHIKKNKGAIMRTCSQLKGKADMKMVSEIVNNILI